MKDAKVWTRFGDTDDYEPHDTPHEAGCRFGNLLNPDGNYSKDEPKLRWRGMGVESDGFSGDNYISLFWGDDEARPVNEPNLNESEKLDFIQGIREGLIS